MKTATAADPIETVLSRLDGVARAGDGWQARCPAHDDRHASLSIDRGNDGRALVRCHAGCDFAAIVAALNLKPQDLFSPRAGYNGNGHANGKPKTPSPEKAKLGRVVATYDYRDAAGTLLYQCLRFDPKDFRQRQPDGNGGWKWNLSGVKLVLYRLPELLADLDGDPDWVFIAEGEKDVDNLRAAGAVATCGPMGAGKWKPHFGEHLIGRRVCIIADKDTAGRKHADDVARDLIGKAGQVVVVEVTEGKDASDYLAAGGTLADLIAMADAAPEWTNGEPERFDQFERNGEPTPEERFDHNDRNFAEPDVVKPFYNSDGDEPADEIEPLSMEYEPFPTDLLPEPLRAYTIEAAQSLDCDAAYIAAPLLVATASAIGNTRRLELKRDWTEPPILWAAVIGESGTVKSPAFDLGTRAVWRRQADLLRAHGEAMGDFKEEHQKWKALGKKDREEFPEPAMPSPCEHPLCQNVTVEAIADRLKSTPRGVLVAVDELGQWLGGFNQYKKSGNDASHWLSLYGGRALKIDRKTGDATTIYVEHAAASVCGTVQPGTLRRLFTDEVFDTGLAARVLLVNPPTRAKRWTEHEISPATAYDLNQLFDRLYSLRFDNGTDGREKPKLVQLSPSALARWRSFVDFHNAEMEGTDGPERAALAKLEGIAARFALVFHEVNLASGATTGGFVDTIEIEKGIELVNWWKGETRRVYREIRESEGERATRLLLNLLSNLSLKGVYLTPSELKRRSRLLSSAESYEEALDHLEQQGHGKWVYPKPSPKGGAPSKYFTLNT